MLIDDNCQDTNIKLRVNAMKLVIVPDSFKGTMTSTEVCEIIRDAALTVVPTADIVFLPMADGGEGTTDALLGIFGGERLYVTTTDPLGRPINTYIGISKHNGLRIAFIETAAAAGLNLVRGCPDAGAASTYGMGRLISAALDAGCTNIIIGLGGSATTDGGIGCCTALGARFTDESGHEIPLCGNGLASLRHIDLSGLDPRLKTASLTCMCDVTNPLFGENGAAYVYSPQKGANPNQVRLLDAGLRNYASVIKCELGIDASDMPGGGAAGGLGCGLSVLLGASLKPGTDLILDAVGYENIIYDADLIITGEGQADFQSACGKLPYGVARRSGGKPVVLICGAAQKGCEALYDCGITAIFATNPRCQSYEEACRDCRENLRFTALNVMRLFIQINS